jgi:hypothetical protein
MCTRILPPTLQPAVPRQSTDDPPFPPVALAEDFVTSSCCRGTWAAELQPSTTHERHQECRHRQQDGHFPLTETIGYCLSLVTSQHWLHATTLKKWKKKKKGTSQGFKQVDGWILVARCKACHVVTVKPTSVSVSVTCIIHHLPTTASVSFRYLYYPPLTDDRVSQFPLLALPTTYWRPRQSLSVTCITHHLLTTLVRIEFFDMALSFKQYHTVFS